MDFIAVHRVIFTKTGKGRGREQGADSGGGGTGKKKNPTAGPEYMRWEVGSKSCNANSLSADLCRSEAQAVASA